MTEQQDILATLATLGDQIHAIAGQVGILATQQELLLGDVMAVKQALEQRPAPAAASAPRETTGEPPRCWLGDCRWRETVAKSSGKTFWGCSAKPTGEYARLDDNGYCRLQARPNKDGSWRVQDPKDEWAFMPLEDR